MFTEKRLFKLNWKNCIRSIGYVLCTISEGVSGQSQWYEGVDVSLLLATIASLATSGGWSPPPPQESWVGQSAGPSHVVKVCGVMCGHRCYCEPGKLVLGSQGSWPETASGQPYLPQPCNFWL